MVSAHDVAAFLIEEQNAAGRAIDKLQLEKLLFLVQGAHLELWGDAAFREPIKAYQRGPVVDVVEQTYREVVVGTEPILAPVGGHASRVPGEVAETINLVLNYFGSWTGPSLEKFVKQQGSPWRAARGGLSASAHSSMEIDRDLIKRWFARKGINPSPPRLSKADRELFDDLAVGKTEGIANLLQ